MHNKLLPFALLALSQSVFAAQPPSAGSQIQQIPATPAPQKAAPEMRIERGNAAANPASDQVKIAVKALKISGAQAYSEAALLAVTGFTPGSDLTLSDLRTMATRIADEYRKNGYFVAQAYLPVQDIKDGIVTIAVIEGQYGKITLRNQTNLSDNKVTGLLDGINSGDVITSAPLESRLLLLSDIPGVNISSTLAPGASIGTSDLIVDVTPGQRVTGSIDADNAGNRYTGENRLGATININNPLGLGDIASIRTLVSDDGLAYARASYQMPFGKVKAGVAYSKLRYSLGREFDSLDANGTASIASIYANYPLIRSRNNNLYIQLAYDAKKFHDKVDSTSTVTDKSADVWMTSLYGDHRDNVGGGSLSLYSLTWSAGRLDIRTPAAAAFDAETVRTNGHFTKLGLSASRLQNVTESVSLYAAINGQIASKNLDVSEKMELGGANGVRSYPAGEAYGDQGYFLNLEARLQLPKFSDRMPGQMQLIGFVDTGTVTLDKNPWNTGKNRRTLSGTGVGINWADYNNFVVKAYYAHKLGNEVATSAPDSKSRFWIQAVKYF